MRKSTCPWTIQRATPPGTVTAAGSTAVAGAIFLDAEGLSPNATATALAWELLPQPQAIRLDTLHALRVAHRTGATRVPAGLVAAELARLELAVLDALADRRR